MKNTAAVNNPKKPRKNAACLMTKRIMLAQKALTSVAIEGNRLAERLLADIAAVPDPYTDAPSMHLDLPSLSRYADSVGKKIVELSAEEIERFRI